MRKHAKYRGSAQLILAVIFVAFPAINGSALGPDDKAVRESSVLPKTIKGVYWKYDNKIGRDGRFSEYDSWLEFRDNGTFTETVKEKWSPTGNMQSGQSQSRGERLHHISTGKYTLFSTGTGTYDDWVGELVYDDGSTMSKRMIIPRKLTVFMPPEGFNLSGDPILEHSDEMNWKRTRAVGERPTPYENF